MTRARIASLLGIATLLIAWIGLPRAGLPPFSTHMAGHMLVVAVAAPLLALALVDTWAERSPAVPVLLPSAIAASMIELVVVWGWHAPAAHLAARTQPWALAFEQGSFLASGVLLWAAVLGRGRLLDGMVALLLTAMHMTLLAALVAVSTRPLFGHAAHLHAAPSIEISPLADQQLGGAIMFILGNAAYLGGALLLAARGLSRRGR